LFIMMLPPLISKLFPYTTLFRSVYKCKLFNGENVFIKIPYSKLKFQRELEAYEILKEQVSIPNLLAYWSGDEEYPGAFLLSELKDRKSTRLNSSHVSISYAVFCL